MNNSENLAPSQVLEEFRKHEKGCDKRHGDITKNFDKTNKNIRNWVIGGVAFLSLIVTILSVFGGDGGGNVYVSYPPPSQLKVPTVQAQEVQAPVKDEKVEQPTQQPKE